FITSDKKTLIEFWIKVLPAPYGRKTLDITVEVANAFGKYLRAQVILLSITMIISVAGLWISGAEYALTVGMIIGFMDLVPVLGPGSIYVPWMAWSYYSGNPIFAVKLLVLYAVVVLVRQVFETKVVSDSLGIHPLATLISMYVGLQTIGIPGLFLGPITVIGIQAVIKTEIFKEKI
ncbi:MAG TPA: AI-2E family transporter, partial [Bacillota bacterium]|nr:AI-2E family transporter [Bacillota bacterium]